MWAKVNPFSPLGSGMRITPFWTRPVNGTCLWMLCWSKIFSHPCYLLSSISCPVDGTTKLCWSKGSSHFRYLLSHISCPMDGMDQIMLKQGLFSTLINAFMHLLSNWWNGPNYVEARSSLTPTSCFHAPLVPWMDWAKLMWRFSLMPVTCIQTSCPFQVNSPC